MRSARGEGGKVVRPELRRVVNARPKGGVGAWQGVRRGSNRSSLGLERCSRLGGRKHYGGEEWEWTEQWGGRGINQVREGGHLARSGQHEGRVVVESGEQRGGQDQAGD